MAHVRTPEDVTGDRRAFGDVREVLAGRQRVPLDASAWSMLRLMLFKAEGCDVLLTASAVQVWHGSARGSDRYMLRAAPACVSQLLEWSDATLAGGELRALLPATTVLWRGQPTWPLAAHQWWVRDEGEQVRMALRPGDVAPAGLPWPAPLASRSPRWRLLEPARPCPHCQRPVERARDLGDALVCPHCARSYRQP